MKPLGSCLCTVGSNLETFSLSRNMWGCLLFSFRGMCASLEICFNQAHRSHHLWNGALSSSLLREVAFVSLAPVALCMYLMHYVSHRDMLQNCISSVWCSSWKHSYVLVHFGSLGPATSPAESRQTTNVCWILNELLRLQCEEEPGWRMNPQLVDSEALNSISHLVK